MLVNYITTVLKNYYKQRLIWKRSKACGNGLLSFILSLIKNSFVKDNNLKRHKLKINETIRNNKYKGKTKGHI